MKTKKLTYGNAIIFVHRPELTEAEKAKREKHIEIALQQFGKAMQEQEGKQYEN